MHGLLMVPGLRDLSAVIKQLRSLTNSGDKRQCLCTVFVLLRQACFENRLPDEGLATQSTQKFGLLR